MARVLGIGTATPATRLGQRDAAEMAVRLEQASPDRARSLRALYRRSGVGGRGVVVTDGTGDGLRLEPGGPGAGTQRRVEAYMREAPDLAERACLDCLERSEVRPVDVTHLITVSCTGMASPGVDHTLIDRLGLDRSVQRVNVGFMGCHGAVNGLRVARALAAESSSARVLVCCVEVCSVHYQFGGQARQGDGASVANALFGDGSAACLVAGGDGTGEGPVIRSTSSHVFTESVSDMSWTVGDHGFRMTLSARVPGLIEAKAGAWVDQWLAGLGLSRADVKRWAIHPGGPRVLGSLRSALDLDADVTTVSEAVLCEHGNVSSATILFILQQMLGDGGPIVGLAFGPGLSGESFLID